VTYTQIIQLMLIRTPNRIIQIIPLPNDPQRLIRIIHPIRNDLPIIKRELVDPLRNTPSPELHIDMFLSLAPILRHFDLTRTQRNRTPIQAIPSRLRFSELEDCRREVGMCSHDIGGSARRDPRPANDERDINIFFKPALFAWVETMLGDVISVISGIYDVRVIQDTMLL